MAGVKVKEVEINDLEGRKWRVNKGDPGWEAIQKLKSEGFRGIVVGLPLLTGKMEPGYVEVEVDRKGFEERIRHNDCLMALGIERKGEKDAVNG